MAGENCNLNKDEAEILKPSSSSSQPPAAASPASSPLFLKPSTQEFPPPERPERPQESPVFAPEATVNADIDASSPEEEFQPPPATVTFSNRCSCCRKKVGLTGFRCRCGDLFCGRHRYSDAHDCSFDYKAAGREQISKANPLIRASKIIKI